MADPRIQSGPDRELVRQRVQLLLTELGEKLEREIWQSWKRGYFNAAKRRGKPPAVAGDGADATGT
jgi:hypothetical protein